MQEPDLEAELLAFVCEELGIDGESLDRDTVLVSSGLVDSANLVRLAAFVERLADVEIPDRDIDSEHFDSVGRIVTYTRALRGS